MVIHWIPQKQETCYLWDMYEQLSETARTIQAALKLK